MKQQLIRSIEVQLHRRRGRNQHLIKAVQDMPVEALRELDLVLRGFEQDLNSAERKARQGFGRFMR